MKKHAIEFGSICCQVYQSNGVYYNAQVTRCYYHLADRSVSGQYFEKIKSIWKGKKVVVVEGESTHNGVGNDLLSGAISVKRVLCPSTDAFRVYDEILETCVEFDVDNLFLLSLGPTANLLAYDLFKREYRSKLTKDMCLEIIKDNKLFHKVYYGNRGVLFGLLNIALEKENIHFDDEGSLACTDFAITLYMIYYNKYAIYPRRFLTRNNGYDGTGVNCKAAVCSDKKLDMSTEFNMQITGYPKEDWNEVLLSATEKVEMNSEE